MAHALAEAEIDAVIVRAADRLLVANAGQLRLGGGGKRRVERPSAADSIHRYFLVDVHGLVFVQAENVRVFGTEIPSFDWQPSYSRD